MRLTRRRSFAREVSPRTCQASAKSGMLPLVQDGKGNKFVTSRKNAKNRRAAIDSIEHHVERHLCMQTNQSSKVDCIRRESVRNNTLASISILPVLLTIVMCTSVTHAAAIDWPTHGFNLQRTGENPSESVLNPSTVGRLAQDLGFQPGGNPHHATGFGSWSYSKRSFEKSRLCRR